MKLILALLFLTATASAQTSPSLTGTIPIQGENIPVTLNQATGAFSLGIRDFPKTSIIDFQTYRVFASYYEMKAGEIPEKNIITAVLYVQQPGQDASALKCASAPGTDITTARAVLSVIDEDGDSNVAADSCIQLRKQ